MLILKWLIADYLYFLQIALNLNNKFLMLSTNVALLLNLPSLLSLVDALIRIIRDFM